MARGGQLPIGSSSPIWADWRKEEHYFTKVKQIVGHTKTGAGVKRVNENLIAVDCLDTSTQMLEVHPDREEIIARD